MIPINLIIILTTLATSKTATLHTKNEKKNSPIDATFYQKYLS